MCPWKLWAWHVLRITPYGLKMANASTKKIILAHCCGIFHCVWNISASAGSINNQDCIFHFLRFIAFVHSYITIVLNILLKITMLTSFMVTTSKRLDYVCPAANRTWQRLTIISCDLTHERDTYFLNISHIMYLRDGPLEKLWGRRGIFEPQEFFFVVKFLVWIFFSP